MRIQCDTIDCNLSEEGECHNPEIQACCERTLNTDSIVLPIPRSSQWADIASRQREETLASALAWIVIYSNPEKYPDRTQPLRDKARTALKETGYTYLVKGHWTRADS